MSKDVLIMSAYEKLKIKVKEKAIKDNDQFWDNFLQLAKSWPNNKEILINETGKRQMHNIAGIGQEEEKARSNFQEFVLSNSTNELHANFNITIEEMRKMDIVDFVIALYKVNIEDIIYLAIHCSRMGKNEILECLPYIDVIYRVLLDRYNPNSSNDQKTNWPLLRFLNLLYGEVFTTTINEAKLDIIAEWLGISNKEPYVYKQIHVRKIIDECLDAHCPEERSRFVRAATSWWILL